MKPYTRRQFVKTAAVSTAALSSLGAFNILGAQTVNGLRTTRAKVGLIGCGGRGRGALGNFIEACKILGIEPEITAVADVFEDRTNRACNAFDIDPSKAHTGYEGYKKVIESDAEFVLHCTPPNFRPLHMEMAVNAGKHCFVEKPVAVDPVGARKVIALAELVDQEGLTVVAGTQRRYDLSYLENKARIEAGAMGEIVGGSIFWNGRVPWLSSRQPGQSDAHYMTRNWLNFNELSGDHICEQHVHQIDIANWFIGRNPVAFVGMGGRARRETGNQFDFFAVDMDYGNGVHINSQCRQVAGCYNRVGERLRGTEGVLTGTRMEGKDVSIAPIKVESETSMIQEHVAMIKSVRGSGEPINDTLAVAEASLAAIGGRISAYTGQLVRWVDLTVNERSPFHSLELSPSALDFERGNVTMPEEVAPIPGNGDPIRDIG